MSKIIFLGAAGFVVLMLFGAFLTAVILMLKNLLAKDEINVISMILKGHNVSIADLNRHMLNNTPSKDDLGILSGYFVGNFTIPAKNAGKIPASAREYLDFISLHAASANSDAKIISSFNRDLKAKNPDYSSEIDEIESKGIKARK
ncbi:MULTISPECIES: hypothetical protein [Campylobacter]|uniref:Uncharacterized protein n=1 Tax=Campylobacter magnus TaxID=3026462 RepID=A0ABT8T5Y7_9BACT|nr:MULTISPECIES: hypothetical protein [Campylobacter]MDD7703267.1 hypothetical protein [Campylobacteraceae bacterium]MCI7246972.1 hypothetical protein [Campylobacter sp.]MCI7447560.1 hypothetical protein [Campylobacter sp.]MDD0846767.1 hypothetical protein [Campylobacter magnus]MDD0856048.1 hypothetical protein [Campylobacter magnus]